MKINIPNQVMPVCYYPTTSLAVDDNAEYIESLITNLSADTRFNTYIKPTQALEFINHELNKTTLLTQVFEQFKRNKSDAVSELNINAIRNILNNKNRFQEIYNVVVDYAMPDMNGLDFCSKITHEFIYKIMLTGEAEYSLAVDALNDRIINQFIKKSEDDVDTQLLNYISDNSKKVFQNSSLDLAIMLAKKTAQEIHHYCLFDPGYIEAVRKIIQDNNICEYYLYDHHGSYLLVNAQGEKKYLFIRNDDVLENLIQLIQKNKMLPTDVIATLKSKEKLFVLNDDKIPNDWEMRRLPVSGSFEGVRKYYYSLCEHVDFDVVKYNIFSYESYLNVAE